MTRKSRELNSHATHGLRIGGVFEFDRIVVLVKIDLHIGENLREIDNFE